MAKSDIIADIYNYNNYKMYTNNNKSNSLDIKYTICIAYL